MLEYDFDVRILIIKFIFSFWPASRGGGGLILIIIIFKKMRKFVLLQTSVLVMLLGMGVGMIVNHVMSQNVYSKIFDDILNRFKKLSKHGVVHIVSIDPIDEADVWHYHRPQLESQLLNRSVVTVHHDLSDNDPWLSIDKFLPRYREAKKIICLNELQSTMLKRHGIENTIVIPHGYDKSIFKPKKENIDSNKVRLLISSRRYGRRVKGESYLIELLRFLNPDFVEFVLVGGERTIDKHYLNKFGFDCEVHERLPYRIYGNLYSSIDFLFMASIFEGGPANIPEAVASGTPVICNPIGMARDCVEDGLNGVWLSMNPRFDAIKLNDLFSNRSKVDDFLSRAKMENVLSKVLAWDEVIFQNCEVYEEVVK